MALEPAISGVWRVGGTLLITAAPARVASKKMNKAAMRVEVMRFSISKYCLIEDIDLRFAIDNSGGYGGFNPPRRGIGVDAETMIWSGASGWVSS